jgi:hypothetical protein
MARKLQGRHGTRSAIPEMAPLRQTSRYGLARWQLRRAFEYFEQHLSDEMTALSSSQSQHLQQVDFLASRQHYINKYEAALNKLGK